MHDEISEVFKKKVLLEAFESTQAVKSSRMLIEMLLGAFESTREESRSWSGAGACVATVRPLGDRESSVTL